MRLTQHFSVLILLVEGREGGEYEAEGGDHDEEAGDNGHHLEGHSLKEWRQETRLLFVWRQMCINYTALQHLQTEQSGQRRED